MRRRFFFLKMKAAALYFISIKIYSKNTHLPFLKWALGTTTFSIQNLFEATNTNIFIISLHHCFVITLHRHFLRILCYSWFLLDLDDLPNQVGQTEWLSGRILAESTPTFCEKLSRNYIDFLREFWQKILSKILAESLKFLGGKPPCPSP